MPSREPATGPGLSPLTVRLAVFAIMVALALVAIWLIDRRAMIRMAQIEAESTAPAEALP